MVTAAERMATMETKMDNIEKAMVRNDSDHEKLFQAINGFILTADDKYAVKSVETRISKLEQHWWKAAGGFIVIITVINWLVLMYAG
jgi:hypothetical protein